MNSRSIVEARGVHFSYGDIPVLQGVDLSVEPAQLVALVGPNGSGKSTLVRLLLGLRSPASGDVRLFGEIPTRLRQRSRVGYVPQRTVLDQQLPATVSEVVATGRLGRRNWFARRSAADAAAVGRAMSAVGLADRANTRVAQLSGGQQQRVLIARALASEPELLILDEPTTGVDAASQKLFRDALVRMRSDGAAVVLVSHELSAVAADLDRIVLLRKGRIELDGKPEDLAARGVSLGVHAADLPVWLEG